MRATSLDNWHQCFGHLGIDVLRNLIKKSLVSGLDTVGQLQIIGTCEDCIFGKMHMRAYNKEVVHEAEILEHIYIDLWGLLLVVSAGRAHYFMLIVDGASVFQYVEFLREKMVDATLNILKRFLVEAKRLTRKKVLQMRVDRG